MHIPRYKTFSFGCRVNQAEMEELASSLGQGYVFEKEVYIINTCAVTQKAEREAKQLIYKLRRQSPDAAIVVTGCSASLWKKNNQENELPVDLMIDNTNKGYLAEIIKKRFGVADKTQTSYSLKDKYLNSKRAIVKIQDGCQRFCSYCIVPYLRGTPVSVPIKQLIKKISNLSDITEVILTAINTEAYGLDTNENLSGLIQTILDKTAVQRVSFGSINPWSINKDFIDLYKIIYTSPRFVHFFHVPLQSGSNKILNIMKRGYDVAEFDAKVKSLAKINPLALIATDIIVGFLDETDEDFEDTYNYLKHSPINKFHVFRFSKREHTAAYYLGDRLKEPTAAVKKNRADRLIKLGQFKYRQFLKSHLNKEFFGLFIGTRENSIQTCLLDNQVPARIKVDKNYIGLIKKVKITSISNNQPTGILMH